MTFLKPFQRRQHLFGCSFATGPQPQLASSGSLEDGKLDPELDDRCTRLPLLDPAADEPEKLHRAAQRVADDRLPTFLFGAFQSQLHPNLLGACAAQAELLSKVTTQRPCNKQKRLAVLDWWLELTVFTGEHGRLPG